ncbi:putative reverse transcriptase domain-containing protein [Tanacetum coccineum]|uniref:Reverse transcriptase domain-containing protein n=1 Tax=Tanacetum coccineum TaxID=301880 RepID=A0ABQ5AGI3_9ASTR
MNSDTKDGHHGTCDAMTTLPSIRDFSQQNTCLIYLGDHTTSIDLLNPSLLILIRLCTHAKRQGEMVTVEMLAWLDQLMEIEGKVDRLTLGMPVTWIVRGDFEMENWNPHHETYNNDLVTRHRVPVSIISDRDGCFTSSFWQTLQKVLGTRLDMSTTYHPPTDGQSEHTIQTCEDVLRAYMSDSGGSWDVHLPLAKFLYNNSYHSSIRCALFEAWHGRKCRSHVLWAKIGEIRSIGPELVQETTNKVILIKEKLKAARDCQKSYVGNMRKHLELKLKYLADTNLHVHLEEIKVDKTLRFVEEPVEIIDREVESLKRSRILIVKSIGTRSEVMRIS